MEDKVPVGQIFLRVLEFSPSLFPSMLLVNKKNHQCYVILATDRIVRQNVKKEIPI
jgi:hypothetical protein